jgi:hypothetical protein
MIKPQYSTYTVIEINIFNIKNKFILKLLLSITVGYLVTTDLIYNFDLKPSELLDCFLFGIPAGLSAAFTNSVLEYVQGNKLFMLSTGGVYPPSGKYAGANQGANI